MKKWMLALIILCSQNIFAADVAVSTNSNASQVEKSTPTADKTANKLEGDDKIIAGMLRSSVDEVLTVLRNKELSLTQKKEKVTEVAMPLFDVPLMAKLILGKEHWQKLSAEDRDSFTQRFIQLMQSSYFDKVDLLSDETVEYEKPAAGKDKDKYSAVVYLVTKDQKIKILYKFYKPKKQEESDKPWKIYDVEIEGISIVKSYNSQYSDFLKQGTFKDLMAKMQEKIDNFDKKVQGKKDGSQAPKEKSKDKNL